MIYLISTENNIWRGGVRVDSQLIHPMPDRLDINVQEILSKFHSFLTNGQCLLNVLYRSISGYKVHFTLLKHYHGTYNKW